MKKKEVGARAATGKRMGSGPPDLAERIFNGARIPILALSIIQKGAPKIVDCNKAALELIGYEKPEVVDKSVEFLDSDVHSKGDLWRPLRSGGNRSFDIVGRELRRKDGTIFLADLKVSPLTDGRGKQVGSITVVSDLTQRSKMEAKRLMYEDRLVALHRHSVELSSATTMDAIVDFTLEAMQETLNVGNVDFNSVDQRSVRIIKSAGVRPRDTSIELPRNGPGVVVKAANTKKTILIADTRADPSFVNARVSDSMEGSVLTLSELATPVLVDGDAVAVLNAESNQLNAFSAGDVKYLEVIAFHAASAIKRMRHEEKLTALHTHALKLNAATSIDEIVNYTLDAMEFGLRFDHSDVQIVQDGWLRWKGTRGMEVINANLRLDGPGVTVRAANSKETIRIADTRKDPSYVDRIHDKGQESPTMLSELAVPVVVDDQTVAVLNAESTKANAITDSDQRLLEFLTTHVASAIGRMKDEEALANERNTLRTLIDNLPDNIFIKDEESKFVVSNLAHARFLRAKTPDEIVGKTDFDIFPRELAAGYYEDEQAVIQSGQPLVSREERTVDPEGKTRWLLTTKVPLRDDHGKVIGIAGINHDITKRKQMEEKLRESESLRESERKLRAVVHGSPIPQFILDRDHTVICWNSALEEISGIKEDEVKGTKQQWKAFYDAERPCLVDLLIDGNMSLIPQLYGEKYRKSVLVANAFEATDYFPHLGKQGRWLHFTAAVTRDDNGNVTGGVETLEDITELKKLTQELVQGRSIGGQSEPERKLQSIA